MNMAAARRLAHRQAASLLRVNLDSGVGDLFVGTEDLPEADQERLYRALAEIVDYHYRKEAGR